ncbi:MAG: PilN domain-containing protein [Candidatus Woykebacteria bacterium]
MLFFGKKDQKGIDLIPEGEKPLKDTKIKFFATVASVAAVGVFIVVGAILVFLNFAEGRLLAQTSEQLDSRLGEWQQVATTAAQVNSTKAATTQINDVWTSNQLFTKSLREVRSVVPKGASLTSLSIAGVNTLTLQAEVSSAAVVEQLVNNLRKNEFFVSVDLDSVVRSSDSYVLNVGLTTRGK